MIQINWINHMKLVIWHSLKIITGCGIVNTLCSKVELKSHSAENSCLDVASFYLRKIKTKIFCYSLRKLKSSHLQVFPAKTGIIEGHFILPPKKLYNLHVLGLSVVISATSSSLSQQVISWIINFSSSSTKNTRPVLIWFQFCLNIWIFSSVFNSVNLHLSCLFAKNMKTQCILRDFFFFCDDWDIQCNAW